MRLPLLMLGLASLCGCTIPPLPEKDPQQAWIDMRSYTGKLVMAERQDGQRLNDGRYFQVMPGSHTLVVRFDFEINGGGPFGEPQDRMCYMTVKYDHFEAGQTYLLRAQDIAMQATAQLFDAQRKEIAQESNVDCIF